MPYTHGFNQFAMQVVQVIVHNLEALALPSSIHFLKPSWPPTLSKPPDPRALAYATPFAIASPAAAVAAALALDAGA